MPLTVSLKALRVNAGLTLENVADELDQSRETYRKKENGESPITLDEGFALADLFNCTISDIHAASKA